MDENQIERSETHEVTETIPVPETPSEPPITTEAAAVTTAVAAGAVELSEQTTAQAQQVAAEMVYLSQKEFQTKAAELDAWRAEQESKIAVLAEQTAAVAQSNSSILSTLTELTEALKSQQTPKTEEAPLVESAVVANPEPKVRKLRFL